MPNRDARGPRRDGEILGTELAIGSDQSSKEPIVDSAEPRMLEKAQSLLDRPFSIEVWEHVGHNRVKDLGTAHHLLGDHHELKPGAEFPRSRRAGELVVGAVG